MSVTKQQAAALYAAVFNRAPDQAGLNYWIEQESFNVMAESFVAHPVFTEQYGDLDNQAFVEAIYENVLLGQGDAEGIEFWVGALDAGLSRGEFLASFIDAALNYDGDDADALLRQQALENKVTVGLYYTETLGEATNFPADADIGSADIVNSPVYQKAAAAIENVTADPETVEAAKAEIDREVEGNEPDSLTEALEALVAAEAGVSDVLASAAEAVNAAADSPLKGDALKDFIKNYDAEKLAEGVASAKEAVDDAQAKLDSAISERSDARTETFGASTDAASLVAAEIVSADARMTDANIAAAVTKAQQGVNKDPETYNEDGSAWVEGTSTGDKFTAKALQTAMINANSALAADIITNGDDEALLVNLRTAITEYANAGGDLSKTLDNAAITDPEESEVLGENAELSALLAAINIALNPADTAEDRAAAAKTLVEKLVTTGGEAVSLDDVAANKAINDALAQSFERAELYDAAKAAEDAFEATESGGLLVAAEALANAREELNEAVTEAQEDLQEAQDLSDAMDGFKAAYDGAVAELEEAQQYFIDSDLALPVVLDGLMTATEGNDIFLYNSEAATVNGFGLEGEDTIFFGEGFTLFDATGLDITKSGIGNADVLEILWQQVGNNVELYVEEQAFSGSVTGTDELTKVTLVGVNGSELQDNLDNGQLSLGDLLA